MADFVLQPWHLLITIFAGLVTREQQRVFEYPPQPHLRGRVIDFLGWPARDEHRAIRGNATQEEVRELAEDGIPIAPVPPEPPAEN